MLPHASTSVAATTTRTTACLTCGTIKKSGKLSCCARGGSWFGNCGATANTELQYAWHEGIEACKARQSNMVAIGQQRKAIQQNSSNSSSGDNNIVDFKTAIRVTHRLVSPAETPLSVTNAISDRTSVAHDMGAMPSKVIITPTIGVLLVIFIY